MGSKTDKLKEEVYCDSYKQLLQEILNEFPAIDCIYYNTHMGTWEIHYKHSDYDEFDNFTDVIRTLYNL